MNYFASYLPLIAGGKAATIADDIKLLIASIGIEVEEERLTSLISSLKLIDEGKEKIVSAPTGGIVAAASANVSAVSAVDSAAKAKEEKKKSDDICLYYDSNKNIS
ncbi:hypothetical protein G6F46_000533 [Rhizopus delemar]|uniref:60S acidic ribosomal protein P2 n=2 Tax=Rhizopus TaxID=4842 RepID=A0A9P6ZD26_9FUNG|nr:hypothetical protein G6F36_014229 [Rhizopus arrhizus]KAG1466127.1 hypothetical protein G6F55_000689 [Rhizopus delemar]KAG1504510.1 hypothetical protein G6F54_000949 [Rhizopus delemar]KAG1518608.1 hypothetical protein G6F53_000453 [Rhizopus delemar]KAG1527994.1 hypothetical protein G6F52_001049 [Rhizopus delemar]